MKQNIATVNEWAFMASVKAQATKADREGIKATYGIAPIPVPAQLFTISYIQPDVKKTLKAQGRI